MKARYDPDAMYIRVKNGKFSYNVKVDENTIINFDKNGEIIGIELLFVKERNPDLLKDLEARKIITV